MRVLLIIGAVTLAAVAALAAYVAVSYAVFDILPTHFV